MLSQISRFICIAVFLFAVAVSGPVQAEPALTRAPLSFSFQQPDGTKLALHGMIIRPAAPGRYPLAFISHGAPWEKSGLKVITPEWFAATAEHLAKKGWAAVVMLRRGYGASEGTFAEGIGACATPHYGQAASATAEDIRQALSFLQTQPYIDPNHVVVLGHSAGGFGALQLGTQNIPGLTGIVNFAGGRGSQKSGKVCDPASLQATFDSFGAVSKVETLWVYAANDHLFPPAMARALFDGYKAKGGKGEFVAAPAFGEEGHLLFLTPDAWPKDIDAFLDARLK